MMYNKFVKVIEKDGIKIAVYKKVDEPVDIKENINEYELDKEFMHFEFLTETKEYRLLRMIYENDAIIEEMANIFGKKHTGVSVKMNLVKGLTRHSPRLKFEYGDSYYPVYFKGDCIIIDSGSTRIPNNIAKEVKGYFKLNYSFIYKYNYDENYSIIDYLEDHIKYKGK